MDIVCEKSVEHLVVDTTAFIKNAQLQLVGKKIVTIQEVVDEITNKRQLRRLVVLPYDLEIKYVFPENVAVVTEFSKKTGDFPSLSATDIKVMALTYQLEKEHVGTDHLRTDPVMKRHVNVITTKNDKPDIDAGIAGFYAPGNKNNWVPPSRSSSRTVSLSSNINEHADYAEIDKLLQEKFKNVECIEENVEEDDLSEKKVFENKENEHSVEKNKNENLEEIKSDVTEKIHKVIEENKDSNVKSEVTDNENLEHKYENLDKELLEKFVKLDCNEKELMDDLLAAVKECDVYDSDGEDEDEDEDDDDAGWITPSNIKAAKKMMGSKYMEEKEVKVACMTTDFAMQNVLRQMNLNVAALDGRMIKELRTFILRCYTCFKTTSVMEKTFCPNCGNQTLKRVAVSLDENGKQIIHINGRKPLTARGKKFSLPTFKGGKHPNNPILVPDQPMPDNRPSRLARTKNNPLHEDWIAGYSPFVMRDVTSKSAMLGIRPDQEVKHWMRKNPNEARRKRK